MILTLPDEPALAVYREEQLLLELACSLYSSRRISRGLASKLARMDSEAFELELHSRSISNGTRLSDLEADLLVLDRLLKA